MLPKEKKASESSIFKGARPIMHTQQPFATLLFHFHHLLPPVTIELVSGRHGSISLRSAKIGF
jgi:hypothetical protein